MTPPTDPYREWDVAYVLGSLTPGDRREYERHLAECEWCSREVAALAGIPGILSTVPRDRAEALLEPPEPEPGVPATVLPALASAARSAQRRSRLRIAACLVAAAVMGAALALAVPRFVAEGPAPAEHHAVVLSQTQPSPVTASVELVAQPWGTRIDITCNYAKPTEGKTPPVLTYGLYLTDDRGATVQAITWTAGPDSTTKPVGTTDVPRSRITRIEIRLIPNGTILLEVRL